MPSAPVLMQREEVKQAPPRTGRLSKNSARAKEPEPEQQVSPSDYLFVLTTDFTCMLYKFTPDKGTVLVSTGSIADAAGSKREAPYSMFVD